MCQVTPPNMLSDEERRPRGRQVEVALREAAKLRQNTCAHCGDVVPGCERECSTCLDAMEFYSLQQAAQSERGKRAIEKLRATRG